jgi:hypothetical protein
MKIKIAYYMSWGLFWAGHYVSLVLYDSTSFILYPIYNKLMMVSVYVQDWADIENGPWKDTEGGKMAAVLTEE